MKDDNPVKAVEATLGTPVAAEYPDNALKVRRNLMASSLISCVIAFGSIKLDPTSTFFGFKFVGLTDNIIKIGLVLITTYFLSHFIWYVVDAFLGWRLRVTGTRLAFITTARLSSEEGDYPNDPRQSTLYSWWTYDAHKIGNIKEKIQSIEKDLKTSETEIHTLIANSSPGSNLHNVLGSLSQVHTKLSDLNRSVEQAGKTFGSLRIPVSLERFDKWFGLFLKSQNLRWIIIDTAVPIILGIVALFVLLQQIIR